jgi:hypothetical protein
MFPMGDAVTCAIAVAVGPDEHQRRGIQGHEVVPHHHFPGGGSATGTSTISKFSGPESSSGRAPRAAERADAGRHMLADLFLPKWVTVASRKCWAAMASQGFAVGCVFAVNPLQIAAGAPPQQTGSAMSFYQLVRTAGYSVASALSATTLVHHIAPGHTLPTNGGYTAATSTSLVHRVGSIRTQHRLRHHRQTISGSVGVRCQCRPRVADPRPSADRPRFAAPAAGSSLRPLDQARPSVLAPLLMGSDLLD